MPSERLDPGDFEFPDIAVANAIPEKLEFLGITLIDEPMGYRQNDGTVKVRWHHAVRPIALATGVASELVPYTLDASKTGMFHQSPPVSNSSRSVLQRIARAVRKVYGDSTLQGGPLKLGCGHLLDSVAWWSRQDIEFKGSDYVFEGAMFPLRIATPDEVEFARNVPDHVAPEGTATPRAPADYDDFEEMELDPAIPF